MSSEVVPPLPPRFRILRELEKSTGQGRIFVVLDERAGDRLGDRDRRRRLRVVKLCRSVDGTISEAARLRLSAEFFLLASIDDPNIVRVFEHVRDDQYGDYLVLAFYPDSEDLSEFLRKGAPPITTALQIVAGSAKGVAAAHRNDVIHRDIKPSNFLVVQRESLRDVVLLDFGIGKTFSGEIPAITRIGDLGPMTPDYAAPEQWRGEDATTASDVFSLGLVAFEVFSGHRAYTRAELERLARFVSVPVPQLPDYVPVQVAEQVRRALGANQEERGSAGDLLASVQTAITGAFVTETRVPSLATANDATGEAPVFSPGHEEQTRPAIVPRHSVRFRHGERGDGFGEHAPLINAVGERAAARGRRKRLLVTAAAGTAVLATMAAIRPAASWLGAGRPDSNPWSDVRAYLQTASRSGAGSCVDVLPLEFDDREFTATAELYQTLQSLVRGRSSTVQVHSWFAQGGSAVHGSGPACSLRIRGRVMRRSLGVGGA
ncbi:MAG TPA: serine/threonine-protein kinase, partial [Longimicrobium sp.]